MSRRPALIRTDAQPRNALPRCPHLDALRSVSLLAHCRFLPLAAVWLVVVACLLTAPLHAAAVLTPSQKIASWGLDPSSRITLQIADNTIDIMERGLIINGNEVSWKRAVEKPVDVTTLKSTQRK